MHDLGLANETPYGRDGRHEHEHISTDSEINVRLIDLSRIVSSMLETAETPSDIAFLRDEMLHTVAESAEAARQRIMRSPSSN